MSVFIRHLLVIEIHPAFCFIILPNVSKTTEVSPSRISTSCQEHGAFSSSMSSNNQSPQMNTTTAACKDAYDGIKSFAIRPSDNAIDVDISFADPMPCPSSLASGHPSIFIFM
jgi:hypothetical protein